MDEGQTGELVFFAFDLLFLNGESTAQLPLIERKERLQRLFKKEIGGLRYSEHVAGDGPVFRAQACKLGLEGAISKQADRPYAPGDRGIWVKSKCLNREEFVVVGWTDPEGSRSHIGALLLGYYTEDGRLHYAGRAGTGITEKELRRLAGVLAPLKVPKMPLAEPPPRDSRFGSPLQAVEGALGAARAGRGSDLPHLDRRQPAAAGLLPGPARRQASEAGRAAGAASTEALVSNLGTVDFFVQATEPNSPIGVVAGAGSPRFRRACPDRQSLDGFTAGWAQRGSCRAHAYRNQGDGSQLVAGC